MKPLFARFVPRLLGSTRSRTQTAGTRGHSTFRNTTRTQLTNTSFAGRHGDIDEFHLSDRVGGDRRDDIEYGYRVDGGDSGDREKHADKRTAEDGKIKVVQVFQVEHERASEGTSAGSERSSEMDLILDK